MFPQDDHKLTLDELNRKYGTDLNNVSAGSAGLLLRLWWRSSEMCVAEQMGEGLITSPLNKDRGRLGLGEGEGQEREYLCWLTEPASAQDATVLRVLHLLALAADAASAASRKILSPSLEALRNPQLSLSSHANVPVVMQERSRRMVNQCLLTGVPELSVNACMSSTHE